MQHSNKRCTSDGVQFPRDHANLEPWITLSQQQPVSMSNHTNVPFVLCCVMQGQNMTDRQADRQTPTQMLSSYLLKALDSMEPALVLRALFEGRGIRRRAESGSSASINRMDSGSMLSLYSRTTHSIMFFHPDFSESPYLQCCTRSTATFKSVTFFFCGIFRHVPPA